MINGFVVRKSTMTNIYLENGQRLAVTRCFCPDLKVSQVKTSAKDGYHAVQVTYGKKLHEFRVDTVNDIKVGDLIKCDTILAAGQKIKATGRSKGHGFAGVIKRHGFHRQPVSGGQSDRVRAPGSIGAQTPGKVVKGKKMPGHYGNVNKTVTGIKVISIDTDKKEILLSGSVPGSINSWIIINKQ